MKRCALLLAAALLAPAVAHANGRFPATIDIHFKPGDHDVMSLQVTWGVLQTEDGGASWHWICEDAIGFGGVYDPDITYTASGSLWATTTSTRGLASTSDDCVWTEAPAPLGGMDPAVFISQIEPGPGGALYATASTFDNSQLYRSIDDGDSFQVVSNPGGGVDWWESLAVAPTTVGAGETRIYLTGYSFQAVPNGGPTLKQRFLYRSDDSGVNWTKLDTQVFRIPKAHLPELQIMEISPTDPDLVFARVQKANGQGIGDDLWRSENAGATWEKVFSSGDDLTALVFRQNGDILLSERLTGIHVSSDGGQTFGTSIPGSPEVDCMRERDDQVLYLCSKSFAPSNMALGTSTDALTWTPILTYDQVDDAYPSCPNGTTQHDVCYAMRWCCIVDQFGVQDPACEGICESAFIDAGPSDAACEGDADCSPPPKKKGCFSCAAGDAPGSGGLLLAFFVLFSLLNPRRKAY